MLANNTNLHRIARTVFPLSHGIGQHVAFDKGMPLLNIGVARIFDWGCPVLSTVKSEVELFILSQYHKQAMLALHCFCALV